MSKSTHASYRAAMDQLRSVERQIRDLKKRVSSFTVTRLPYLGKMCGKNFRR